MSIAKDGWSLFGVPVQWNGFFKICLSKVTGLLWTILSCSWPLKNNLSNKIDVKIFIFRHVGQKGTWSLKFLWQNLVAFCCSSSDMAITDGRKILIIRKPPRRASHSVKWMITLWENNRSLMWTTFQEMVS